MEKIQDPNLIVAYKKAYQEPFNVYDGRGKGVDIYFCPKCGEAFYTKYRDKGVTPFSMICRECGGVMTHDRTIPEDIAQKNIEGTNQKIHEWVRPTLDQFLQLKPQVQAHCLDGGLILDIDLPPIKVLKFRIAFKGVVTTEVFTLTSEEGFSRQTIEEISRAFITRDQTSGIDYIQLFKK